MNIPGAKFFILLAAMNGFLAVCLGAFGAHALSARLTEKSLDVWKTAAQYHFYHVFALALIGLLIHLGFRGRFMISSGILFACGLVLFCGSLYWLALSGPRWLGPMTPLGGLCFIFGWVCLFVGVLSSSDSV